MRCAILAPGESMSQAVADRVRDYPLVIAVGNVALDFAPWAHALVAQDKAWWRAHPEAMDFSGRKFSTNEIDGVEQIKCNFLGSACNSGAFALEVARLLGATRIGLYGFDMHGSHYFGPHPTPLGNTTAQRFNTFQLHFQHMAKYLKKLRVKVVNRTPGSALRAFPFE